MTQCFYPMNTLELYNQYVLKNYASPPLTLVRGEGTKVWDDQGREYLDFTSGVAVNAIGHSHPKWSKAISAQIDTLAHCSNLFAHPLQGELAQKLADIIGPGQLFFCNSGAEATETLIKLARLHGAPSGRHEVITALNSFHGRTFGGMSATGQEKTQKGYHPLLPGFHYAEFNNIDSFRQAITPQTSAILLETVQGEGGIHPAGSKFLKALRDLCDEHDLLLLIDEIQCGMGRTGEWMAYQSSGISPDAVALAKGLGGGFPIGAAWMSPKVSSLFQPGSHGSTFGGNPMACAAALAVIQIIDEAGILKQVRKQSQTYHQQLGLLVEQYPQTFEGFRGQGYMMGLVLRDNPAALIEQLRSNGLLTVPAAGNVLRLLPPLTVSSQELQTSLDILHKTLSSSPSLESIPTS